MNTFFLFLGSHTVLYAETFMFRKVLQIIVGLLAYLVIVYSFSFAASLAASLVYWAAGYIFYGLRPRDTTMPRWITEVTGIAVLIVAVPLAVAFTQGNIS